MIIDIPLQNPFKQNNKDDVSGSIGETFNVDFNIKGGKVSLPNKMVVSTTTADLTELGLITKFVYFEGAYFAHSAGTDSGTYDGDGRIFKGGNGVDDQFTLPTWTVNTTDFNSDAVIEEFQGQLVLISGDTWTIDNDGDTSWTSESLEGGERASVIFEDRLYYLQSFIINSFTDPATHATSGAYTWTLPDISKQELVKLATSTAGIWIATSVDEGASTYVYLWDGQTENAYDAAYLVPDSSICTMKVWNDTPYIVTGSGNLMAFNGSYFEEVARFPFHNILLNRATDPDIRPGASTEYGKWIHNNGVDIIDGKLHFLVNPIAEDDTDTFGDYPKLAGVWCYDPAIGLYHKYALSVTTDNGEVGQVKHVGALKAAARDLGAPPAETGSFICSFAYQTENSAATEEYAIAYVEPIAVSGAASTGYFTTQRIYSQSLSDSWEHVAVGFEELESTDSIEVKYRTIEREGNNLGVTWASTTSFTSTDTDFADIKTNFDNGTGYECRVLYGNGAGIISQISNITEAGGTYTVTLDTAHTGVSASDTGVVRIENWTSAGIITSADNDTQIVKIPIAAQSNWIQYKIVMRGEEITRNKHNPIINRLVSVSTTHTQYQ